MTSLADWIENTRLPQMRREVIWTRVWVILGSIMVVWNIFLIPSMWEQEGRGADRIIITFLWFAVTSYYYRDYRRARKSRDQEIALLARIKGDTE